MRREILTAFERGVRVVPVMVNTHRFRPDELPTKLARLAKGQDVRVDVRNSEYDLPALVARLKRVMTDFTDSASEDEYTVPALDALMGRSPLMVGVERDGERTSSDTIARRHVLQAFVDAALASSGVTSDRIVIEDRGDRILAVVDAEPLNLLDRGVALITALRRRNLVAGGENWLRLRVAVHRGLARRSKYGWSDADLIAVTELLDAPQVRAVLAQVELAQCALVVTTRRRQLREPFQGNAIHPGDASDRRETPR